MRPSDLLAQFKQTEAKTKTQIWAAELLDNTVELIREMVYTHTMEQPGPHGTIYSPMMHFVSFKGDSFLSYLPGFMVYI